MISYDLIKQFVKHFNSTQCEPQQCGERCIYLEYCNELYGIDGKIKEKYIDLILKAEKELNINKIEFLDVEV